MIKNIKWLLLASLTLVACNEEEETTAEVPVTSGSANFSKYVALGDSFAAGFSDGALFKAGQENSYTNLLALQMKAAGSGDFKVPYMNDDIGGFANTALGAPRLYFNGTIPTTVPGGPGTTDLTLQLGPFNNLGVPGAKSFHLIAPGYGNPGGLVTNPRTANPYFVRMATSTSTTVLADALVQQPSFFSLWIGGNDVLGYALTGGDGSDPITPTATFNFAYNELITKLTEGGKKGVIANLPYVTSLPFFTTVGYNPLSTLSDSQVDALNSAYAGYNGGLLAAKNLGLITETEQLARTIKFEKGKRNATVIIDEYLTDITAVNTGLIKMRQTTADDYIVLSSGGVSAQAHLLAGNGTQFPLQDKWVVSKREFDEIKTATDSFNATIEATATAKGLAFVDAKSIMQSLTSTNGLVVNGYTLKEDFVTGGAFSLDGIHPSPRGYALIANKFIESINKEYGSTLKTYNVGTFRILYPAISPIPR